MKSYKVKAFSLIEMIVVFAVISILFTLLSAKLNKLTEFSHLNHCQTNLKTVFMGTQLFINDNDGYLPGPLVAGQFPSVGTFALAGSIEPYVETVLRSDGKRQIVKEMMCPSNRLEDVPQKDDFRLHYRTHIDKNSSRLFGYPYRHESQNVNVISSPSSFKFLRDISKLEFSANKNLPGWYHLLTDVPAHFGTDVNLLTFDGHIEPIQL